ncbi:glycosyltransferase [Chryseobacterium lacus]|uniref:Glycosyltransferase n=1 Tax=Chryseobacterium lacus TaxID=2058346 RepID=A0A368N028_9FLAO|nr:glycosyltransferase [Chryseobacterium lacus]RCU42599.1 glycosyltransferase [Chryseobacterium lacus]RST27154.1 glycosyltransferase [Chryseobacterium lacus]
MKIISIFCKGNITYIPPVYNSALALVNAGYTVKLYVGEVHNDTKVFLMNHGYDRLEIIDFQLHKENKLNKWRKFRIVAFQNLDYNTTVWYATLDTAIALYGNHMKKNKFIISVLELYDSASSYTRFFLKKILPLAAKVVVPEFNRAAILKTWYHLAELPVVLPNKPYIIELPDESEHIIQLKEKITQFAKGRKIVLYQGLITSYRNIENAVKAVEILKEDHCVVLMGPDYNYADKLIEMGGTDQVLYIGNVNAPNHLHITKMADIGVVSYNYIDLNNIFCAPNKIWEFAAFSKPMLGNDIPGLKYTIESNDAGICADTQKLESVKNALEVISSDYEKFSANASKLFNSVDLKKISIKIVNL